MASAVPTCPQCGARLADDSPLGELCPRCLMTLALDGNDDPAVDQPEDTFGPYRPIQKIGEGGMGIVWLARQEQPIRRDVAVKVVKPGANPVQVLRRFESERQALAILNHPNIATVFDAGLTDDGRPYFVMEYVPGLAITTYADQHALPIVARLALFLQVCEAVAHAHQKGVLHRDLKPANILVSERDGQAVVKVIDFGVAKALGARLSAETMETRIGTLVGTPEYMSPEQAGLIEAAVDTRTDIYSLGLVLYELLVGALPFDARELRRRAVLEMLRIIREEEPPKLTARLSSQTDAEIDEVARRRLTEPRALLRQLRGDLEWITNRALEKEPARRYASASELGADVRHHLVSEPVVAGPPDLRYRLGKLIRRHRAVAVGAGIAALALIVGAVVSAVMWIGAERARRESRDRLKALHVTTGLQLASDGSDLTALPWLVRAMQLDEGGPRAEEAHRIRIRHVLDDAPFPIRIWRHEGLVGTLLASDRSTLATWDHQGTVRIWDAERGVSLTSPLAHPAPLVSVALDGSRLVTADERGTVRVWDTRSGVETITAISSGPGLSVVGLSTTSNRLLSADRNGVISVRAVDSGQLLTSVRLEHAATFGEFLDEGRLIAAGDSAGVLSIYETDSGRILSRLRDDTEVAAVARLDAGRVLTANKGGVLQVWDIVKGTPLGAQMRLMQSGLESIRVSFDGLYVFACGIDGAAVRPIQRTADPRRLGTDANCLSLDLSDDGLHAATANAAGTVRVWSAIGSAIGSAFTPRLPHAAAVTLVRFLRTSGHLLTVENDGLIRVWELRPAAASEGPSRGYTWAGQFSPDGRRLVLASGSSAPPYVGQATVLDAVTGEMVLPPLRHGGNLQFVIYSADGRLIATASDDGSARLWDAATGEPMTSELRHAAGPLKGLLFTPDGRRLLTFGLATASSSDVTIWEVPSGRRVATLPETGATFSGEFSPDGRYLVTVSPGPRRVQLWRTTDGTPESVDNWSPYVAAAFLSNSQFAVAGIRTLELRDVNGSSSAAMAAVAQANWMIVPKGGTALVVATDTGAIHVLERRDLSLRFPPLRLPGAITAVDVSADNKWLLGTSWERRARVWSLDTGEPLTPERLVPLLPLSASFSPDGSRVQVNGREAIIWTLQPDSRPADVLEKLAQLLSGHQLVGTELVPLSSERLIELAADPQTARTVSPSVDANWRRMVGRNQLNRGNWTAAAEILAPLVTNSATTWETHAILGTALAELDRWAEARRAFAAALERRPDSTELIYYDALSRVGGGDRSAVDSACAAAMQKFGATGNPDRAHWLARLCVLSGIDDSNTRRRIRDLARVASDMEPDIGRHANVYAAALIGAGDPAQAEQLLLQLASRPAVREREEEGQLILAWIQRQQGRSQVSARTLSRYETDNGRLTLPWHRRIESEMWRSRIDGQK